MSLLPPVLKNEKVDIQGAMQRRVLRSTDSNDAEGLWPLIRSKRYCSIGERVLVVAPLMSIQRGTLSKEDGKNERDGGKE